MTSLSDREDLEEQVSYGVDHSFSGDFDTGLDASDSDSEDDELEVAHFCSCMPFSLLFLIRLLFPKKSSGKATGSLPWFP